MKKFLGFVFIVAVFLGGWFSYSIKDSVYTLTEPEIATEEFKIQVESNMEPLPYRATRVSVTPKQNTVVFDVSMNDGNCELVSPTEKEKFGAQNYPDDFPRELGVWYRTFPVDPLPLDMLKGQTAVIYFRDCVLVNLDIQTQNGQYTFNY